MTTKDDLALLQQTMPTGVEGVKALEKFAREGNGEVRKLLYEECDVLLECRYCRNIFRSVINFISHKRAFCRASHVAVVAANAAVDDDGKIESATRRRNGQMTALTRRLETSMVPIGDTPEMLALYTLPRVMKELPTTTFTDGLQKVIGSLPAKLARKEELPEDRVVLTMPQDNSSRYKEMSLRSRKAQNMDKQQHREFNSAEIKIIEYFEKHDVRCGDYVLLQCDHPSCAHFRPFSTLQALAYHCSLRHTRAFVTDSGEERWPCLLCCRHMWSLENVRDHLIRVHSAVKEDHLKKRKDEDRSVKGAKGKNTYLSSRRSRSLSMDAAGEKKEGGGDEEDGDDEEEEEDESEQQEEMIIEEEEGRGRRRSVRGQHAAQQQTTTTRKSNGTTTSSSSTRATSLPKQKPTLERRPSRATPSSDHNSDDYGEPPVLHPADEEEEEEETEEESESMEMEPRAAAKKGKEAEAVPPPTPDMDQGDMGGEWEEMREIKEEEMEADEEQEEEEEKQSQKGKHEQWADTVESCVGDMIDLICEKLGEPARVKKSHSSTPSVDEGMSRRIRSSQRATKTGAAEKESSVARSSSRKAVVTSSDASGRTKRQYIKKADRERMEQEKRKSGGEERADSAGSEPSTSSRAMGGVGAISAPSSDESRPQRHRKRPRWMVDEEMRDEEKTAKRKEKEADRTHATESEEEEKEEMPKIKRKVVKVEKEKLEMVEKAIQKTPPKTCKVKPFKSTESMRKAGPSGPVNADEDKTLLFTPRAGKVVIERRKAMESAGPSSGALVPSSSSKRKQNLGKLADESEEITIVSMGNPAMGTKKSDLSNVPVYLSEHQQSIFFAGLIQQTRNENKGKPEYYLCIYCDIKLPNIRDGRRHMVAHLRVMRLRCGLCGVGAFFCIDMRNHLQLRGCPELSKAPAHMIRPGTPCMTREHADELTFVAHSGSPGRALFTSGKIVSILSNEPYLPDPVIEEKILGPTRVPPRNGSPRKPPHKLTTMMSSALKETDKGTVSLAAAQRATAAPAVAAAAAAAVLPLEQADVRYYEDASNAEQAARDAAAAAARADAHRRATMAPPDPRAFRVIGGDPANGQRRPTTASPARAAAAPAASTAAMTPQPRRTLFPASVIFLPTTTTTTPAVQSSSSSASESSSGASSEDAPLQPVEPPSGRVAGGGQDRLVEGPRGFRLDPSQMNDDWRLPGAVNIPPLHYETDSHDSDE